MSRYTTSAGLTSFLKEYVVSPGFRYTVWMRLCGFFLTKPLLKRTIYIPAKLHLIHLRYKFGFVIPEYTAIGPGLFMNRFGGVYINGDAIIGCNVNITPGTVLGQANRGPTLGSPIIGDRVFLGHGCKVIGRVRVGDDGVVGAGSVLTKDTPPFGVALGMPAKVRSMEGSMGYVNKVADLSSLERWLICDPAAPARATEPVEAR